MKLMKRMSILMIIPFVFGCWPTEFVPPSFPEGEVMGYAPVYTTEVDLSISWSGPEVLNSPGQIYLIDTLVLLIEENQGIHVVGNSNPTSPNKLGFLKIDGASQLTIKDGVLYTNQYSDVIAIDLSDVSNPTIISRDTSVLSNAIVGQVVPPGLDNYFECPDPTKGRVISWEYKLIDSPKCYK